MKTLILGTEKLRDFEGNELDLTLKQAFIRTVANASGFTGEDALRLQKVALDLVACKADRIELEDHDFDLLQRAVSETRFYLMVVTVQMQQAIKAAQEIPLTG